MSPEVTERGTTRLVGIEFSGTHAQVVFAGPRRSAESLLQDLDLTAARPVLLVIGGAGTLDPAVEPQLQRLFERGAIRAAAAVGATVLDGGTASGVMAILGRAAAASDASVQLLGVAPAGKVTFPGDDRQLPAATTQLEANHSHFLLANSGEWGGETTLMFDVFDVLARDQPAAVLLAGGGPGALDEVALAAERGLPIVVITGTGGLADALAAQARSVADGPAGDSLADVAAAADFTILPLMADPADLGRALTRFLQVDETLAEAWRQQKLVSNAAGRQQGDFRFGQSALLLLGLLVTYLVVAKSVLDGAGVLDPYPLLSGALYVAILVVPITVAVLAAASSRMRPGGRWILLRGTAESLKGEIFRYRARTGIYSHDQTRKTSREVKLAQVIGSAMGALMRTDVNLLALDAGSKAPPKPKPKDGAGATTALQVSRDNPLAPLTPTGYVTHRLDSQIRWYRGKVAELERNARWLRWLALIFGGIGTLLAALGVEIWVAVTTSLVGIYTTILEAWQLETTVTLYNQAATDLTAIRAWWFALPPAEQDRQENIDRLVEKSERIMRAEHVGWVQEMQDAMTELRLEQSTQNASGAGQQPGEESEVPSNGEEAARARTRTGRVSRMIGGRRRGRGTGGAT